MPPTHPVQPTVTKLTMTLKAVTIKTSANGEKTVQFGPKTSPNSSVKTVMSV